MNHLIALDEVLGSWQGDDTVQFIELRMLADGQQHLSQGAQLAIDDASGDPSRRRILTFPMDASFGIAGARVLIATRALSQLANLPADFVLPAGVLSSRAGRVCYQAPAVVSPGIFAELVDVDCVAYGSFAGDNGRFGRPTPITPDDRSLQRRASTGDNRSDWTGVLEPTPENNGGTSVILGPTLCGDGQISPGEECDGKQLGGETCAGLGFVKGTLACDQCHFDTTRCTFCGNGVIDRGEECDGADLGGLDCAALSFTGGTLTCTPGCRLSTGACDPTFFVPGGQRGPDCLAEWRLMNAAGRPGARGLVPARQRCKDGDIGCDQDAPHGTCTLIAAVCFGRDDARLRRAGHPCTPRPVESWTLLGPSTTAGGAEAELAGRLLAAVAALGPSMVTGDSVSFSPPLDAAGRCTEPVLIVVPLRDTRPGSLVIRTRTAAARGRPRDLDALKLICVP